MTVRPPATDGTGESPASAVATESTGNAPALVVLSGIVVHGDKRGRALGFPTANLRLDSSPVPADGLYAAIVTIEGTATHEATVSVGTNPTFDDVEETRVEVHLHDVDLDLYGRRLTVEFVERLRETIRFADAAALIEQSRRDVAQSRSALRTRLSEE